jgi:hypothetical protein
MKVLDAGNITGYAAIETIQRNEETGEAIGIASNTGANKYPWGIAYFEEEITQKTNDNDPANSLVVGRYKITQELDDRTLVFEQDVEFKSNVRDFNLRFHRWISVDGDKRYEKTWEETIPRDYQ